MCLEYYYNPSLWLLGELIWPIKYTILTELGEEINTSFTQPRQFLLEISVCLLFFTYSEVNFDGSLEVDTDEFGGTVREITKECISMCKTYWLCSTRQVLPRKVIYMHWVEGSMLCHGVEFLIWFYVIWMGAQNSLIIVDGDMLMSWRQRFCYCSMNHIKVTLVKMHPHEMFLDLKPAITYLSSSWFLMFDFRCKPLVIPLIWALGAL